MTTVMVMIPAYNEERTIGEVIAKIPRDLGDKTSIVVINDGSTDKTGKIAEDAGAEVVTFRRNRGLVETFRKGIEYSISNGADIIVNIDADAQYVPAEIKKLIAPLLKSEADIVLGSRFKGYIESMPKTKRVGNIVFTTLLRVLTKENITDGQTGFRAFTKEVAERINVLGRYTYTQQMIIQASYHKFKIVEEPVTFYSRKEDESRLMSSPLQYTYRAIEILLLVTAIYHPLKFFGLIGIFLIIFGALLGIQFREWNVLSSLIITTGIQFSLFGVLFKLITEKLRD